MSGYVGAVPAFITELQATMDSLPSEMQAAASTGSFGAVLAGVRESLGLAAFPAQGTPVTPNYAPLQSPSNTASTPSDPLLASPVPLTALPAPTGVSAGAGATGATTTAGALPSGQAVIAEAEKYLGVPYLWGGTTPQGFDCSGLVQYVYGKLGVSLPRTSEEQALVGTAVPSLAQAQPGDLLFFAGSDGTPSAPGHVGIYVGNGQMLDAYATGTAVRVEPISDAGAVVAIRRVDAAAAAAGAPATAPTAAPTAGTAASSLPAPPSAIAPLLSAATTRYGLPPGLLQAIAWNESRYQTGETSSAGAEGLMQLMPQTAASLGVDPMNPAQAVDGAARLLSSYIGQFGSVPLAVAAYNAGAGAVEQYGGIPPFGQTQAYVSNVMSQLPGGHS